jgi:hypothetical protein
MVLLFVVCGWREEAVAGVCLRTYLVHSTYVFLCTRARIYGKIVKPTVHKKDCAHKKNICTQKKQKTTNIHLFYFVFFVHTNIRVNNFPLCEKACLWHALDSRFRTLASYFSYCTKMESCKNTFLCALILPKKIHFF